MSPLVEPCRAFQGFAVDGNDPARRPGAGVVSLGAVAVGQVGADGGIQGVAVEAFEHAADRRSGRGGAPA
jgi:hypothetical protein